MERNLTQLQAKDEELRDVLEKMEDKQDVDIDEAIVPSTPLYKQLLVTYAEEQATEDALYYLGEALRREVVDLDVYLKVCIIL